MQFCEKFVFIIKQRTDKNTCILHDFFFFFNQGKMTFLCALCGSCKVASKSFPTNSIFMPLMMDQMAAALVLQSFLFDKGV